jgi:hypothetical protein
MRTNRFRIVTVVSLGVSMAVLGTNSGSVKAQYALAAPGGSHVFLRFLESFQQEDFVADPGPPEVIDTSLGTADAYYKAVDPFDRRLTMKDWLITTGFLASDTTPWTGAGSAIPDLTTPAGDSNILVDEANGGRAKATYVNGADLGFGRRMYLRTNPGGSLASYVENYGTDRTLLASNGVPRFFDVPNGDALQQNILDVVKTRNPNGLVATVVMEYVAPDDDPTGKKRTTFYVYGADGNRVGIAGLNLDGRGSKANPGVCLVCHGGKPQALVNGVYPNKGDTGAYFLPWDVATFIFDAEAGFTKADQEKNFRELNRAVASHHQQGATFDPVSGLTRRVAPVELIRGWYGGATLPNDTFDESFVPVGWRPSVERGIPVGARKIYREVIGPTCRACHAQRESALDFATFKGFDVHRASSVNLTFTVPHALANGAVDDSPARPGDDRAVMPLALRTYENFWNSTAPAQLRNFINSLPPL